MKSHDREVLRVAQELLDWLELRADEQTEITLPLEQWDLLQRLARQQHVAVARGWRQAEVRLQDLARREIERTRFQLGNLAQRLNLSVDPPKRANTSEIYRDLKALEREFPEVRCDLVACQIVVTTAAISFEGVDLGAFEIQLGWESSHARPPYRVVAKSPNADWGDDSITHPHVQNDELCEGQGAAAIESALAAGRFFDFFLLVARVLHTYAPHNAYQQINQTSRCSCGDCGDLICQEECSNCLCGESLCDACITCCTHCDSMLCSECVNHCWHCKMACCEYCLNLCEACQSDLCKRCLHNGDCLHCKKEPENDYQDTNGATQALPSSALPTVGTA